MESEKPTRKLHPSTEVSKLPWLFGLKILVQVRGWEWYWYWGQGLTGLASEFCPAPWLGPSELPSFTAVERRLASALSHLPLPLMDIVGIL